MILAIHSQEEKAVIKSNIKQKKTLTHLHYLDGFRGLAALCVLINHISFYFYRQTELLGIILYRIGHRVGFYAVDIFIVLSGFCLMLPIIRNNGILKGNSMMFFKKRARRILPTYYLAMVLSLLLISTIIGEESGTLWSSKSIRVSSWDIFSHLIMIQDCFADTAHKINYAFWSISVEWRIYFIFPILVYSWRRVGGITTVFIAIITSIILFATLRSTRLNLTEGGISPHYLGLFCFGMLSSQISYSTQEYFIKYRERIPWKVIVITSIVLTIIADLKKADWVYLENIFLGTTHVTLDFMVGITASCLLVALAAEKFRKLHQLLSWQPLAFIGTYAYSIYLIHAPLLEIVYLYILISLKLSSFAGILFLYFIGIPLILLASYLFFKIAEQPFIHIRKNELSAQ